MPFNNQVLGDPGRLNEPELIAARAKKRAQMKQLYLKTYTDPYRHATGQGGFPFEPAHQRYYAMKSSQKDFFRPNFYTAKLYSFIVIIPMFTFGYIIHKIRSEFERKCRNGEIAYKDRHPKYLG